jgi:hypothetical protein
MNNCPFWGTPVVTFQVPGVPCVPKNPARLQSAAEASSQAATCPARRPGRTTEVGHRVQLPAVNLQSSWGLLDVESGKASG